MCSPALGLEPQHETGVGFRSVGGRAGRGGGTSQPRPLKRGAHVCRRLLPYLEADGTYMPHKRCMNVMPRVC